MHEVKHQLGLTLVELMITLAVLGIFVAVAVPSFSSFMQSNKLESTSNELANLLQFARSLAAEKSASIIVCESSGTLTVRSKSTTADVCAGTELRNLAIPTDLTLRSSNNALPVSFSSTGTTGNTRTLTICKGTDASNGYKLTIGANGNIRRFAKGKTDYVGAALASCTP